MPLCSALENLMVVYARFYYLSEELSSNVNKRRPYFSSCHPITTLEYMCHRSIVGQQRGEEKLVFTLILVRVVS